MKPLRVCITVRRLMVAVAMVGVLLGALLAARAWRIRQGARYHQLAVNHRFLSTTREQRRLHGTAAPDSTWTAKKLWHVEMSNKYERAANYPWLSVEPDTPEPN